MSSCAVEDCEGKVMARGWCGRHYARWRTHGSPDVCLVRPKDVPPPACAIEGCDSPVTARGWCKKHYYRWKNHGDPLVTLKQYEHPDVCTVDGCDRPYSTRGYCALHYKRLHKRGDPLYVRPPGPTPCSVAECDRPVQGDGLCSMHRRRWHKHGDITVGRRKRQPTPCSIEGCDGDATARGYCGKHYARWQTHGDPLVNKRGKAAFRATLDWRKFEDVAKVEWNPVGGGYRGAQWPEHPSAPPSGRIGQHVAVMSAVLGRPVRNGETVHHKNGIRHDNRPSNLELWAQAHHPGQRVSELIAFAHEIIERYRDDMQLWPEHLRP